MLKKMNIRLEVFFLLAVPFLTGFTDLHNELGVDAHIEASDHPSHSFFLETERTLIRPLQPSDAEVIAEILINDEVSRGCGRAYDLSSVANYTSAPAPVRSNLNWKEPISLGIVLKDINKLIGLVRFGMKDTNLNSMSLGNLDSTSVGEIGYAISNEFSGRGITTEVVRRISDFCFEDLGVQTLFAETLLSNIPSQRVLIKSGFTKVGEGVTSTGKAGAFYYLTRSRL